MDGVLYDSMSAHVLAWHETMSSVGITPPIETYYLFEGRTGYSTINILFQQYFGREATMAEQQSLYDKKAQRFVELSKDGAKPMPGAWDVLQKTKRNGLQRIIVTGSGQLSLFEKLNTDFPGMFDREKMITAYDVQYGKPHPEPYLKGLEKAGVSPDEAVVVENAPLGIEASVAAGIYTIGVNTGPLSAQVLSDAGANVVLPSMSELGDNLEHLLKNM
jgi:HAD superfamily hydrolase (TIGR01509 family)